jgi:Domain of unknown function (DUF4389)
MTTAEGEAPPAYPVQLQISRPDTQSRLTNFPLGVGLFIRYILIIPHLIILYFFNIVASILYFIACFAILFTGKYPRGLFNFYVGYTRWNSNVYGYVFSLYDKYPPFSMEEQAGYPLSFRVDYPDKLNRILNLPIFIGLMIKAILLIPHLIILVFLILVGMVVLFIAQFAILFTGSFPTGMHGFLVGIGRWSTRVNAYLYALTDQYPPFSLD